MKQRDFSRAIRTYERFLRQYKDSEWIDETLFALSNCYREIGKQKESIQMLQRIIDEFPGSNLKAEALYQLGNFYYAENNFLKQQNIIQK